MKRTEFLQSILGLPFLIYAPENLQYFLENTWKSEDRDANLKYDGFKKEIEFLEDKKIRNNYRLNYFDGKAVISSFMLGCAAHYAKNGEKSLFVSINKKESERVEKRFLVNCVNSGITNLSQNDVDFISYSEVKDFPEKKYRNIFIDNWYYFDLNSATYFSKKLKPFEKTSRILILNTIEQNTKKVVWIGKP